MVQFLSGAIYFCFQNVQTGFGTPQSAI